MRLDHHILWLERVLASVAKEAIRSNRHLASMIDAVVADYELSAVVGEYHVYRPRATG